MTGATNGNGHQRIIGLGELEVSGSADAVLVCLGLGSCVALCAYDPVGRVGGMAHMVLPASSEGRAQGPDARFVDLGVPLLIDRMRRAGALRSRLVLKIAGGAHILAAATNGTLNIGRRNAEATREILTALGLQLHAEDTGGGHGRTVRLHVGTGEITVSTAGGTPRAL